MRKLSIKGALYLGAALVVAVMLLLLAFSVFAVRHGTDTLSSVYERRVVPTAELLSIDAELKEVRFRMAAFLVDQMPAVGNQNQLAEARRNVAQAWHSFKRIAESSKRSPEAQDIIAQIDRNLVEAEDFFERLRAAYAEDDKARVRPLLEDEFPVIVWTPILKPISKLIPAEQAAVKETYEESLAFGNHILGLAVLLLGTIVITLAIMTLRLVSAITRPLRAAVDTANRIAAGDFESPIIITGRNEIGALMETIERMRGQVRSRQERLKAILDYAAEGIVTFDEHGRVQSFNKSAEQLFGFSEQELLGAEISVLIPPAMREKRPDYISHLLRHDVARCIGHEGEVTGRHKDGSQLHLAMKVSQMSIEGKIMYTALLADISERKAMLEHLKTMAERDGLTGLYNRSYFQEELARVTEQASRTGAQKCAVLYIDLDNFKYVNDTLGHASGDRLLIEVAGILNRRARKSDLIARFGGDEFTVLLYNTDEEGAQRAAESFRSQLASYSYKERGEQVDVGCSIGVVMIIAGDAPEDVLSRADLACHQAKRGGRNRVHVFSAADKASAASMSLDIGWARRIKEAIEQDRFALACQPIVDTKTNEIACYEVLIRMLDEDNALIMPNGFLPSAERFGLSADIDRWVIVHAIRTLAQQRRSHPKVRYAINLSAQTLSDLTVCDLIKKELDEAGVDPAALTFEVTETVAIADMRVAEIFLGRLRQIGCKTALDDFGSGMSSFAYLRDLPVDIVKIDGRFVRNIAQNSIDEAMVRAMNDIGHALSKETVAEFVEDEAGFALLREIGVDYGQGFFLGRPDVVLPCKAISEAAGLGDLCAL